MEHKEDNLRNIHAMEVIGNQNSFAISSLQNTLFHVPQKKIWVNGLIYIFGWTMPLPT